MDTRTIYYGSIFAPSWVKKRNVGFAPEKFKGPLFRRPESQKPLSEGHPVAIFPCLIEVRFLICPLDYNGK